MMLQAGWVEIPAQDIERAVKFYEQVLEEKFEISDDGVRRTAILSDMSAGGVGVSLNQTANFPPSSTGTLAYFNGDDLEAALKRVEASGGKVVLPKTLMGEGMGNYCMFQDTEGNTLALHSMS